jgi:hypothetical protein
MRIAYLAASAALSFASVALAQTPGATVIQPAAQSQAMIVGSSDQNVLRAGVEIPLLTSEALTTEGKKLRVGQRFQLEVADNIMLNGVTVIPKGSPATGEITDVRNKGMWGKSGRINTRMLFVRVNGRQIRLTGAIDDKGVTGTGGVVAAVAFLPVAGFFTTGTSARIPMGSAVKAFLDEDLTVAFAPAAAPQPMIVPAPSGQ